MTRKVVTQLAARAQARERLHERYAREEVRRPGGRAAGGGPRLGAAGT